MLEEVVTRIQTAYETRYREDKTQAFEGKDGVICMTDIFEVYSWLFYTDT